MMAYLYGYYSEDPNYPEGVRVNIEAIYEPPQFGGADGAIEIEDARRPTADMIASGLNLELVGWIFTKPPSNDKDTAIL
jgi:nuclear protein localization family protein 4